jgi:hypothetical protein
LIFVDTNVFMYAVGREHPLKREARAALLSRRDRGETLATSAEVLQELLHAYLPVNRIEDLDAALRLAGDLTVIWPVGMRTSSPRARSWRGIRALQRAFWSTWHSAGGTARRRCSPMTERWWRRSAGSRDRHSRTSRRSAPGSIQRDR